MMWQSGRPAGRHTSAAGGTCNISCSSAHVCWRHGCVCARAQSTLIPLVAGLKLGCFSEQHQGGHLRKLAKKWITFEFTKALNYYEVFPLGPSPSKWIFSMMNTAVKHSPKYWVLWARPFFSDTLRNVKWEWFLMVELIFLWPRNVVGVMRHISPRWESQVQRLFSVLSFKRRRNRFSICFHLIWLDASRNLPAKEAAHSSYFCWNRALSLDA